MLQKKKKLSTYSMKCKFLLIFKENSLCGNEEHNDASSDFEIESEIKEN